MKAANRLRKNEDFRRVYNNRNSIANRLLILYIKENHLGYNRAGFTVSKKLGKSVVRNKIKRRIRESYRLNDEKIKQGYDLVFIARNKCVLANYWEIESALMHLIRKKGLLLEK